MQILHHGTTAILWEPETPSDRSCYVYFRLERSCAMVTWHRPTWRKLKTYQEFSVGINPEDQRLLYRPQQPTVEPDIQNAKLDEGFLDLEMVKEITIGSRNHEYDAELLAAGRKFGLTHIECCVSILYGSSLSDNRVLCLLCPPMLCRLWYVGLNWIIKGIKRQQKLADRSMLWLKEQYIKLYFEDSQCNEPMAADAIQVFGGKDWGSANSSVPHHQNTQSESAIDTFKREGSIKFKKKRSVVNLLSQATSSSCSSSSGGRITQQNFQQDAAISGAESRERGEMLRQRTIERRKEQSRIHSNEQLWQNIKSFRFGSITYETQLDFLDFIALFKSFR